MTPRATCVLAANPGPMTLDGTNTWVLLEPGSEEAVVIDPGPDEPSHLGAVLTVVQQLGARVTQTLLTHGHPDHSEGARRFADLTGSVLRAAGAGRDDLAHDTVVRAGALELRVLATPGHTRDSISFVVPADRAVLTGDTVLGRGTTVVAHPDGALTAYLDSLTQLAGLVDSGEVGTVLPGHGPVAPDAAAMVTFYERHRHERLAQVRDALADGAADETDIVEGVLRRVYADVSENVWGAARLSIRAQLDYLGVPWTR